MCGLSLTAWTMEFCIHILLGAWMYICIFFCICFVLCSRGPIIGWFLIQRILQKSFILSEISSEVGLNWWAGKKEDNKMILYDTLHVPFVSISQYVLRFRDIILGHDHSRHMPTKSHSMTSQKTVIFMFTHMRTSDLSLISFDFFLIKKRYFKIVE
jgi:hypothetical protein